MYEFFPKSRDGQQYRFLAVADKHSNAFKFNLHCGFLITPQAHLDKSIQVISSNNGITFQITPVFQIYRDTKGNIFLGTTQIYKLELPNSLSPKSLWKSLWVSDNRWDLRVEFMDCVIEIERDFIRILVNGKEVSLINS